jgi:hypothetical protein
MLLSILSGAYRLLMGEIVRDFGSNCLLSKVAFQYVAGGIRVLQGTTVGLAGILIKKYTFQVIVF